MNELYEYIDDAINEGDNKIDIKELSAKIVSKVELNDEDIKKLLIEKIEILLRSRIAKVKDGNHVRDFYAIPTDSKRGVYINAMKSTDVNALESAARALTLKIVGMEASRDKVLSQVFRLRHNVEIRDDATLDLKEPYKEDD